MELSCADILEDIPATGNAIFNRPPSQLVPMYYHRQNLGKEIGREKLI